MHDYVSKIFRECQLLQVQVQNNLAIYQDYQMCIRDRSCTMIHDDGHDKITGRAVMADAMDLDADGNTEERLASAVSYTHLEEKARKPQGLTISIKI